MARMRSPEEAAEKAAARQREKIAAAQKRREERAAEKQRAKDSERLFRAHCMDAAKHFAYGDAEGVVLALDNAARMVAFKLVTDRPVGLPAFEADRG